MDATMMQDLISAIERNTAANNELISLLKRERQPWISPEEAARLLGLPLTKSRSHRRRLSRAVDRGQLTEVRAGRPPSYYREEILEAAEKIRRGEMII